MNPPAVGTCSSCRGTGEVTALLCPPGKVTQVPCRDCRATGRIDDARAAEITEGLRRRADRLERGLTQAQEAERLGMDRIAYSRLENPR